MKKLLLLIGFVSLTMNAQIPSYVPTNGLKAYYPFNSNANDVSGNSNNGTVNGATLTTDRFGNANSAYSFNGISNFINIASNILPTTSNSLTVSLWFLTSGNGTLISDRKGIANESNYSIGTGITNLAAGCESGLCSATCGKYATTIAPSLNNWNNAVLVKDKELNVCKIYLNGVLAATRFNFCYTNFFTNPTAIGRSNSYYAPYGDGYLNGKIDDVGIWNRALTEAEITTMYNGVTTDTCTGLNGTLRSGLSAYYPFCGNANDQSGNSHNGTVTDATLTTDRFGNPNSAYYFNGTSSYIYASNISSLSETAPFNASPSRTTVSLWMMNSKSNSTTDTYLFDLRSTDNSAILLSYNPESGKIQGINSNNRFFAPTTGANTLSINQWYHVVYIKNNDYTFKLYVNGVKVGEARDNVALLTNPKLNIGSNIGSVLYASNNRRFYFKGAIDDVCFWNRALTETEITNLFNATNKGQLSYAAPIDYAVNITIAPNPASTQVNIAFNNISDLNGGSIKIINSLGQQISTTPIKTTGTTTTMTLSTWGGSGLYFVQIVNPQGQIVDIKKILLQ